MAVVDWQRLAEHPKIFCGFSNITALHGAFRAHTDLVTYYGPSFASLGGPGPHAYTLDYLKRCLMDDAPFTVRPSRVAADEAQGGESDRFVAPTAKGGGGPWTIRPGAAGGTIVGGCLSDLNLLQGTPHMPPLEDAVVFLEDDQATSPAVLDRALASLLLQRAFGTAHALVFGCFPRRTGVTPAVLADIVHRKPALDRLPVIAGADFGHVAPRFTFPIGGTARIDAPVNRSPRIRIAQP